MSAAPSLFSILLCRLVETFIIDTAHAQNNSEIPDKGWSGYLAGKNSTQGGDR